jgi:hypothetical protein
LDNFGDIDDMADMGVIEMPYQVSFNCERGHVQFSLSGIGSGVNGLGRACVQVDGSQEEYCRVLAGVV